jgi:proteasome lid subunit RPN8/RPN11
MSVFRTKPLRISPATGLLVVNETVINHTQQALRAFGDENGGRHEGLVFWAGKNIDTSSYVLAAIVPECEHEPFRVVASPSQMGDAARAARKLGLGLISQIHSHPDSDTRHSDGDDVLVFMPYEGMFSLVVGNYGDGSFDPNEGAGLHQYQNGEWVQVENAAAVFRIVPSVIEVDGD